MPPKQQRIVVERAAAGRRSAPRGVLGGAYDALTSAENASVVRSIAVFGAAVAFFTTSWGEMLVPVF